MTAFLIFIFCALLVLGLMPSASRATGHEFDTLASTVSYLPIILNPAQPTATPTPTVTPTATATDPATATPTATATDPATVTPTATATPTTPATDDWLAMVNAYRAAAGVPSVTDDATLNDNCFQHARYMAENHDLTHSQNSDLPYASPAGQICAENGNAWLGSPFHMPIWEVADSIDGWMSSVGHRLWLLYPTTPIFGYGFYTAADNGSGGALDVLSEANFSADASYGGWPVRYPASGQTGIPAEAYAITLNWMYFGPTPSLSSTSLTTQGGASISHTANTALPVGHKGVQIIPNQALPDNTIFTVTITGNYDGAPFSESWQFSTGDTPIP